MKWSDNITKDEEPERIGCMGLLLLIGLALLVGEILLGIKRVVEAFMQ